MTPSAINALGWRLAKTAVPAAEDLETLTHLQDEYMSPLEQTGTILREKLKLSEEGTFLGVALTASNRLKTTGPIIDKCRRKTRLSTMQDIVGFRIVGDLTLRQQDELVKELRGCFEQTRVVDRRAKPMHGYRAVHLIAEVDGFPVEIQVRTVLQDRWAQMMESYGDIYGREIRYGELPPDLSASDQRAVERVVERLKVVGDELARYDDVWGRLMQNMRKIQLLEEQREQYRPTRRIKRSLEAAVLQQSELEQEFAAVERGLDAAMKRLTA
jgi:ppGpp synthetase/RelA/SpoT-type nucleotidyltranferase